MGGRARDRCHRDGARVGREDRAWSGGRVERPEDRSFGLEILERRFDDEVRRRGRDVVEGRGVAQALETTLHPGVGGIGIEIEAGGAPFEAGPDARPAALDGGRVDVVDADLVAGFERELGDPRAHRPGTHHADDARRGLERGQAQTGLIASNGWRQSAQ